MSTISNQIVFCDQNRLIAMGKLVSGQNAISIHDFKDVHIGTVQQGIYTPATGSVQQLSQPDINTIVNQIASKSFFVVSSNPIAPMPATMTKPPASVQTSAVALPAGPTPAVALPAVALPAVANPTGPTPAVALPAGAPPAVATTTGIVQPQAGSVKAITGLALLVGAHVWLAAEGYISVNTALTGICTVAAMGVGMILAATGRQPVPLPVRVPVHFQRALTQGLSQGNIQLQLIDLPKLLNISRVDTLEQAVMGNVLQAMCQMPGLMQRMKERLGQLKENDLFSKGAAVVGDTTQTQNPTCPQKKLTALLKLADKFALITGTASCRSLTNHQAQFEELRDLLRTITENGLEDLRGLTDANKQAILETHVMLELYVTLTNSAPISKEHLTHLRAALQRQGSLGKGLPEEILNAFVACIDGQAGHVRQIDIKGTQIAEAGEFPETVYALALKTPSDTIQCSIGTRRQKYTAVAVMFGGDKTLATSVKMDGKWSRGQDPLRSAVQPALEKEAVAIEQLGRDVDTSPHLVVYQRQRENSVFARLSKRFQ